jgi:hypothetical protein
MVQQLMQDELPPHAMVETRGGWGGEQLLHCAFTLWTPQRE